jgi:hypothetical protein
MPGINRQGGVVGPGGLAEGFTTYQQQLFMACRAAVFCLIRSTCALNSSKIRS